jgi:hypothetical protein
MTTLKEQVRSAAERVGENPETVLCLYRPHLEGESFSSRFGDPVQCRFADLPEREFYDGFGSTAGEPFIGFSESYVYVRGCYDGSEWIEAVPRTMTMALSSDGVDVVIGGG